MNKDIKELVAIYQKIINLVENNKVTSKQEPYIEIAESKKDEYNKLLLEFVECMNNIPFTSVSEKDYANFRAICQSDIEVYLQGKPINIPIALFGLALLIDLLSNRHYQIYYMNSIKFNENITKLILQM